MNGNFVSYLRVSTERQGRYGLGLAAQQKAVEDYLNAGGWRIVDTFTETESGKPSDRPELMKALRACKAKKATLVIARLDRLSRDVHFISGLMKSGIDFVACDFPQANKLTIHILAAVAEHEREMISARTKAALKAADGRGKQLGSRNLAEIRVRGTANNQAQAQARAANVLPIIAQIQAAGITTLEGIAKALNERAVPAPRGGEWHRTSVMRVLKGKATVAEAALPLAQEDIVAQAKRQLGRASREMSKREAPRLGAMTRERKLQNLINHWVVVEDMFLHEGVSETRISEFFPLFRQITADMDKLEATMAKIAAKEGRQYQPVDRPALLQAERARHAKFMAEYRVYHEEQEERERESREAKP